MVQVKQSVRCNYVCLCVYPCVRTITLELIGFWPRYLAWWFVLTLFLVTFEGQRYRSQLTVTGWKYCYSSPCDLEWGLSGLAMVTPDFWGLLFASFVRLILFLCVSELVSESSSYLVPVLAVELTTSVRLCPEYFNFELLRFGQWNFRWHWLRSCELVFILRGVYKLRFCYFLFICFSVPLIY